MSAAALSLYDHVALLDVIGNTLAVMDADGTEPEFRALLEAELLSELHGTREKIDRTAGVLASFDAAEVSAQAEIDRLTARKARICKERTRLENYVLHCLITSGSRAFEGESSTLALKTNPASLIIDDACLIPAAWLRTPEPPPPPVAVPDKAAIKAAMKKGIEFAGCHLEQTMKLVRS